MCIAFGKNSKSTVISSLKRYKHSRITLAMEENFFASLKEDNNPKKDIERAARFFVLNRITFSGTTETGGFSEQAFNKRFTQSSIERLKHLPMYLKNVDIRFCDYEQILKESGSDVFIFLDPPYYSPSRSKLYGKKGYLHTNFDHCRFAKNMEICRHKWLITYDDCKEIRNLFSHFAYIYEWKVQYGMNNVSASGKANKGNELFITNYPLESIKSSIFSCVNQQ